jgi:uncharacterized protein (DUF302 family)
VVFLLVAFFSAWSQQRSTAIQEHNEAEQLRRASQMSLQAQKAEFEKTIERLNAELENAKHNPQISDSSVQNMIYTIQAFMRYLRAIGMGAPCRILITAPADDGVLRALSHNSPWLARAVQMGICRIPASDLRMAEEFGTGDA